MVISLYVSYIVLEIIFNFLAVFYVKVGIVNKAFLGFGIYLSLMDVLLLRYI